MKNIRIQTPARICLFGDHQDYLELPVIACAIDRFINLTAEENETSELKILMPDIHSERTIGISETFEILEKEDYLASALKVLRRYDCIPNKGYTITFKSEIPINAGVSSSSAVVISWIHFLLAEFGCSKEINSELIAKIAYEAEVLEHNSPGGKMDQFTIAIGNIIFIETSGEFSVQKIRNQMKGLVLGESGIPKETIGLLGDLRGKANEAVRHVQKQFPEFLLDETSENEIDTYLPSVPKDLQPIFIAAIKNHVITQTAFLEFKKDTLDYIEIGRLMNEHHKLLKNNLKITVPKIDAMIDAALDAGAYGAKIIGSGGGGSIVALSPPSKEVEIVKAIKNAGGKDAYSVEVSQGSQILLNA
ncbi:MAG: galactokinase [Flavobacteriaceae bacterium]|nr:galactokinase [Flavobacteriaceae bacterium]